MVQNNTFCIPICSAGAVVTPTYALQTRDGLPNRPSQAFAIRASANSWYPGTTYYNQSITSVRLNYLAISFQPSAQIRGGDSATRFTGAGIVHVAGTPDRTDNVRHTGIFF